MTRKPNMPTDHLELSTRTWVESVVKEFVLEDHHFMILVLAGEARDRGRQARELLAREGLTIVDRFGSPRPHPAVAIEKDSAIRFARLVRELGLDVDGPTEERARPPLVTPSPRRG